MATINRLSLNVAGALILAIAATHSAPSGTSARSRDTLVVAHDFLEAAYPDASGKGRFLSVCVGLPIDDSWRQVYGVKFQLTTLDHAQANLSAEASRGKPIPPSRGEVIFGGTFQFDGRGGIELMEAGEYDFVNWSKNRALETLIESHPEWSDAEAYNRLKEAGARFGPSDKDQFVRSIHLERFERVLGPLHLDSVKFNGLPIEHVGNFALVWWSVQAHVEASNGSSVIYAFNFEPFDGKLTGLKRFRY